MVTYDSEADKYAMAVAPHPIALNKELHELLELIKQSGASTARVELLGDPRHRKEATDRIRAALDYYGHSMMVAGTSDIEIEVGG